jgi:hypothetical protein
MTSAQDWRVRPVRTAACFVASLLLSSCLSYEPTGGPGYPDSPTGGTACEGCADKAKVCSKPNVRALACDLDELERHIERYGSVVAKQPDVWGQARLTKHREEFEKEMAAQLGNFDYTLQGSVWESDQAYLADAFALSAAASAHPASPGLLGRSTPRVAVNNTTATGAAAQQPDQTHPAQQAQQTVAGPTPLPLPDLSNTFAAFSDIKRTPLAAQPALEFAGAKTGITVEPTVKLDQRARYLNHLHELRRINEGDDTADSPGYALNLVRIPVSVLPGKCTEVGHGAEVTMTLTPYLSDELLPTTFRNLILNDLVDQLGLPVTVFLNNRDNRDYLSEQSAADLDRLISLFDQEDVISKLLSNENNIQSNLKQLRWTLSLQKIFSKPEWSWLDKLISILDQLDPKDVEQLQKEANGIIGHSARIPTGSRANRGRKSLKA